MHDWNLKDTLTHISTSLGHSHISVLRFSNIGQEFKMLDSYLSEPARPVVDQFTFEVDFPARTQLSSWRMQEIFYTHNYDLAWKEIRYQIDDNNGRECGYLMLWVSAKSALVIE